MRGYAPSVAMLSIEPNPRITFKVRFRDEDLLVVEKRSGLTTQPGKGHTDDTLLNGLFAEYGAALQNLGKARDFGLLHRLDKDTSGLLVVAKTLEAQTDLVRQLQARSVGRIYLALVHGIVETGGTVDAPIGRHPVERTRMAVTGRGKPARTHYEVLEHFENATLLQCRLETGRTHQIRVHMHSIGHPLIGDPLYGRRQARGALARFGRQALHAERLALVHPVTGERCEWRSPLPADMAALLQALREEAQ